MQGALGVVPAINGAWALVGDFFLGGDHIAWPRPWKNGQRIVPYSDCMRHPVLRRLDLNFIHIFEISFS